MVNSLEEGRRRRLMPEACELARRVDMGVRRVDMGMRRVDMHSTGMLWAPVV